MPQYTHHQQLVDVVQWLGQLDNVFDEYANLFEAIAAGRWAPTGENARIIAAKIREVQASTRVLRTALAPTTGRVQ